ncbi:hypothetical protein RclHR1_05460012, partial [Rhizophagus clarus]
MSNTISWLENSISDGNINYFNYSDFKNITSIGSSSSGGVFRATWKNTNHSVALKWFNNDEQTLKKFVKEVKSHRKVDIHENIIRFYGVTYEANEIYQQKKYSLVLEYADSGTLEVYLKNHFNELDWNDKYQLALQLASAVECIHNCGIIHCDLHAYNILVHRKNIKLADFGLSKKMIDEKSSNESKVYGVIPYIDPKSFEFFNQNDDDVDKKYELNEKSDIYSIGVLMWQISSGHKPFYVKDEKNTKVDDASLALTIFKGKREKVIDGTPDLYRNLYQECWKFEPNERPSINKVVTTLESIINKNNTIINKEINNLKDDHDDCSLSTRTTEISSITYLAYQPLITAVSLLTQQIVKAYENAQYNKKSCKAQIQRVQAAEAAVQALNRSRRENEKNFCKPMYYISFERFIAILREVEEFVKDVTHLSGYRKFISNDHIKERFLRLITEFDNVVSDLQLAMVIADENERNMNIAILQDDVNQMTKFLEKIGGGVTRDNKINDIFEDILTLKSKISEIGFNPFINKIDSNELLDPDDSQPAVSSRNTHKKLYGGQVVACKLIVKENKSDKFDKPAETVPSISSKVQAELAVLSYLGKCDYIIKFYGLCEMEGGILGIFGWTENGNLRELYKTIDIEWPWKLKIALNICCGIIFLHGCQILHQDIRCENILITENLNPKISNFKYTRALQDNVTSITRIIRWLAPEKMNSKEINQEIVAAVSSTQQVPKKEEENLNKKKEDYVPYTIQCEIFSFGMLLWELAFQRFPYKDMEISEIQKHVLTGKREYLNFPLSSYDVEKEYGDIIKAAWQPDPSFRPELNHLFNYLEDLRVSFIIKLGSLNEKFDYFNEKINNLSSKSKATDSPKNSRLKDFKETVVDTSKFVLEAVSNIGEAVGPYLPLITAVASLTQQIEKAYESAQYNKKSCAALIQRVQAAEVAVKALNRRKQENEKKFRNQSYYYSFERFVAILKDIKGFVQDVTHLSGYRKFISSIHIQDRFRQLITDFDSVVGDLQLAMVIANEEERKMDIEILQEDISEMTKFLEKIEGGVTTIDKKISNILELILTLKGKSSKKDFNPTINRIDSNELNEPFGNLTSVLAHNKHKIHKKLYRGQDVACKLIIEESGAQISNRIHAELAILSNLGKCDYIINFHRLCEKDGSVFSVFDWAENGNLRELYEKFDIEWPRKLKIALN